MRFPAGARLGPYEIDGIIAADAMGEAYRARDTRLTRPVALKTLPALFAADADRLTRFKREAQINKTHRSIEAKALIIPTLAGRLS
jgi:serine/threonine protein kinase